MDPELQSACDSYLHSAFTEIDRTEIEALINAKKYDELRKRMLPRISFGTSGFRGRMEAGYARMNDLTVFQASIGLRDYILKTVTQAKTRGIVIGHDHRLNSQRFAQIVEAVFAPVMKVYVFNTLVHTPLVPFSVKTLGAACGVMITASHNPKQDNGYKVYGENSCAIIPPHDHGISEAILIAAAKDSKAKPQFDVTHDSVENVYEAMTKAYFGRILEVLNQDKSTETPNTKEFKFCYTAMHGVGLIYARIAMSLAQSSTRKMEMVVVAEQALPDPTFSTVKFPNPEEKGALEIAMQTADNEGISVVVATDPDADRLGAAEKVNGKWHTLTGNQIGLLLASALIKSSNPNSKRALLSSAVSSKMLQAVGRKENIYWEETLTGFKWLGNRALQLREEGYNVILAYEEALGFMPYDVVYDKDGILSMTILLRLAQDLYAQDETLTSELSRLYDKYGSFASVNGYFIISEQSQLKAVMRTLRSPSYPTTLGNRKVVRVRDLTTGYDSATKYHVPTLPVSASSEMLTFWFEAGNEKDFVSASMTIRGSGTEPKLKYYIEAEANDMDLAAKAAKGIEEDMIKVWLKAFNLRRP